MATNEQIDEQHRHLIDAFRPYNISWELSVVKINSSQLRHKTIIFGCDGSKIGNKQCNLECRQKFFYFFFWIQKFFFTLRHPLTGNDGGDCDDRLFPCETWMLANDRCDLACNRPEHNWDNGQCCNESLADVHKTCTDPKHPFKYAKLVSYIFDALLYGVWKLYAREENNKLLKKIYSFFHI